MLDEKDKRMLDWVRFVATKFAQNSEPWKYSRDHGHLEHIRYSTDHTGYNAFRKRLLDGLRFGWRYSFQPKRTLDKWERELKKEKSIIRRFSDFWFYFLIRFRKDKNLPDGVLSNGVITHWGEDGEYIVMFSPTVGVKVLDFLEAEPENPHARAILAEMRKAEAASFGRDEDEEVTQ